MMTTVRTTCAAEGIYRTTPCRLYGFVFDCRPRLVQNNEYIVQRHADFTMRYFDSRPRLVQNNEYFVQRHSDFTIRLFDSRPRLV